jgi:hypothetical protein
VRDDSVPREVILVWLGVCNVPLINPAVIVPEVTVPVQLKVVKVPKLLTLGCADAVTVTADVANGGTKSSRYWKFSSNSLRGIDPDCVPNV